MTEVVEEKPAYSVQRCIADVIQLHVGYDYAVFMLYVQPDRKYYALAIESSYGGFAYAWSHPGGDFRAFLAQLNIDYVRTKMIRGENDDFDEEKTRAGLNEEINRMVAEGECTEEQAEDEREEVSSIEDIACFWLWAKDTVLFKDHAAHEFIRACGGTRHREFTALYEKFWPAFAAELRKS